MSQAAAEAHLQATLGQNEQRVIELDLRNKYTGFDPYAVDPDGYRMEPSLTTLKVLDLLEGSEPKRILDVGAGVSIDALFLASYGNHVTVVDHDLYACEWQADAAYKLGLSDHLRVEERDARELNTTEEFDVVMSSMLLHFLTKPESQRVMAAMQAVTKLGGFNAHIAYSSDNPKAELEPPRDLAQLFEPSELEAEYPINEWRIVESYSGAAPKYVDREYLGKGMVLIPSYVELITQRTSEADPYAGDAVFYDWTSITTVSVS